MKRSIEERIRDMYLTLHDGGGILGLAFDGPASREEANAMLENGMVSGGMIEGTELWFIDPINRTIGPIEREVESLNTKGKAMSERPSFSSPLYAALRQGAKELAQALPAFPDSIQPVNEAGTLGNPTPSMVTDQIEHAHEFDRDYEAMLDRAASAQREQENEMERD